MGWGVWPHQESQQPFGDFQQQLQQAVVKEPVPILIPLQPQMALEVAEDVQPDNAEEIVINVNDQGNPFQGQQIAQDIEAEVIAMDDLIDGSNNENAPQLPILEPVQIVPLPNFANLQPLMPEEIQPEDLMDSLNDPVDGPIQVY
jgi:hypothetical protein